MANQRKDVWELIILGYDARATRRREKKKLQGRNVEPEPSHYTTVRELGYSLSASNDKQWASIWKFMNEVFVQSQRKLEIFSFSFPFSAGKVSQDGRLGGIRLRLYAHLKMAMGVDE